MFEIRDVTDLFFLSTQWQPWALGNNEISENDHLDCGDEANERISEISGEFKRRQTILSVVFVLKAAHGK